MPNSNMAAVLLAAQYRSEVLLAGAADDYSTRATTSKMDDLVIPKLELLFIEKISKLLSKTVMRY